MRLEADPMRRRGFALVAALVVLVLLGSMGALMVRVTGVEQVGTSLSLLGARADLAARSGLEWAVHRVVIDGDDEVALKYWVKFECNPDTNSTTITSSKAMSSVEPRCAAASAKSCGNPGDCTKST